VKGRTGMASEEVREGNGKGREGKKKPTISALIFSHFKS